MTFDRRIAEVAERYGEVKLAQWSTDSAYFDHEDGRWYEYLAFANVTYKPDVTACTSGRGDTRAEALADLDQNLARLARR